MITSQNMHKKKLKYIALYIAMCFYVTISYAQALSVSSYGIWDRGEGVTDFSDSNYNFVLGIESSAHWSDVNPSKDVFDFSIFQLALDKALENQKLIRFSIGVGPNSPVWMYDREGYNTD